MKMKVKYKLKSNKKVRNNKYNEIKRKLKK